jgi:hypothetical protein
MTQMKTSQKLALISLLIVATTCQARDSFYKTGQVFLRCNTNCRLRSIAHKLEQIRAVVLARTDVVSELSGQVNVANSFSRPHKPAACHLEAGAYL